MLSNWSLIRWSSCVMTCVKSCESDMVLGVVSRENGLGYDVRVTNVFVVWGVLNKVGIRNGTERGMLIYIYSNLGYADIYLANRVISVMWVLVSLYDPYPARRPITSKELGLPSVLCLVLYSRDVVLLIDSFGCLLRISHYFVSAYCYGTYPTVLTALWSIVWCVLAFLGTPPLHARAPATMLPSSEPSSVSSLP